IGEPATDDQLAGFVNDMASLRGALRIPGLEAAFEVTDAVLEQIGRHYLCAVGEAGRTYRHIAARKGVDSFVTEVSADETTAPQAPLELFFILGALARENIPLQTIAPKFSGKFLKGVDYIGDVRTFLREFDADLAVVAHAIDVFGLPASLKLSVHTGSDKFSLYPGIRRALRARRAGLHVKTAGTTWLEEVIGVALSGSRGLELAKQIYVRALSRFEELCRPYATVVEIDRAVLPEPAVVAGWSAATFVSRLRHDPSCAEYSSDLRQLLHVSFKVAAEMGGEFYAALHDASELAGNCVTDNLFTRHLRPLFLDP
ncbi:MAG: tagaturonate epimerase family protein, partial [Kofleriaceae bacterium]